jgi:hypothetical protein
MSNEYVSGRSNQSAKRRIHPTQKVCLTLSCRRGERQMFSDQATERRQVDSKPLRYGSGPPGARGLPQDARAATASAPSVKVGRKR